MLKPSIVLTSLTKPLHAACCVLPTNVNVWMMLLFIPVSLVELRRLQDELPNRFAKLEGRWDFVSKGFLFCI